MTCGVSSLEGSEGRLGDENFTVLQCSSIFYGFPSGHVCAVLLRFCSVSVYSCMQLLDCYTSCECAACTGTVATVCSGGFPSRTLMSDPDSYEPRPQILVLEDRGRVVQPKVRTSIHLLSAYRNSEAVLACFCGIRSCPGPRRSVQWRNL